VDAIFFDVHDRDAFRDKITFYLSNPKEARKIAMNGYYKALRYHRYVNRVDYVFNTVDHLLDDAYRESGMAMKERGMRTKEHIFRLRQT
jgi:spore maturation protein CgeB